MRLPIINFDNDTSPAKANVSLFFYVFLFANITNMIDNKATFMAIEQYNPITRYVITSTISSTSLLSISYRVIKGGNAHIY